MSTDGAAPEIARAVEGGANWRKVPTKLTLSCVPPVLRYSSRKNRYQRGVMWPRASMTFSCGPGGVTLTSVPTLIADCSEREPAITPSSVWAMPGSGGARAPVWVRSGSFSPLSCLRRNGTVLSVYLGVSALQHHWVGAPRSQAKYPIPAVTKLSPDNPARVLAGIAH